MIRARGLLPDDWEPHPTNGDSWSLTRWGAASVGGTGGWFGENPTGFTSTSGIHQFYADVPLDICFQVVNTLQAEVDYISYGASNSGKDGPIGIIKSYDTPYSRTDAQDICDSRSSNGAVAPALRIAIFK